ncbi:MAG TPA: 30S ribosomal protein S17 [Candidatus Sulfotelmatobacter sp.]|jgi:small subunit ribosomal protein S17|nr:30S ribosomal protein S17 [Candidatus Sulfotelmatobacter sp.]
MAKVLIGKVISVKMQNTVVVEVSRRVPHPLYKKLLKKGKHFNVDTAGQTVEVGNEVRIVEIKPMSKTKYFAIKEVITKK